MMLESNGSELSKVQEQFVAWVTTRHKILTKKQRGEVAPWSDDPIMQSVYFTNVRREDDKVTVWISDNIRKRYVNSPHFTAIMCLARMINKPSTLQRLINAGVLDNYDPLVFMAVLQSIKDKGHTVWGGAYVVTTHGRPMPKAQYAAEALHDAWNAAPTLALGSTLASAHKAVQTLEGFASFMAAQVVADLKNTEGHALAQADDWWTWAASGPGSKKGINYFMGNTPDRPMTEALFKNYLGVARAVVEMYVRAVPTFCNQDLQNCFCEFGKYMRVTNGGRSKRKYNGAYP
jgi:hypothetical protein